MIYFNSNYCLSHREQRVTGFFVGVLLALSVPMEPFLVWIPLPILYGVLLLVGVASFSNIQVTPPFLFDCFHFVYAESKIVYIVWLESLMGS